MLLYPDLQWVAQCPPCLFGPIAFLVRDQYCSSSSSNSCSHSHSSNSSNSNISRCFKCVSISFIKKKLRCFRVIFAMAYLKCILSFLFPQGLVKFLWEWGSVLTAQQHHLTNQVPGQMACCPWNKALMGLKIGEGLLCDSTES